VKYTGIESHYRVVDKFPEIFESPSTRFQLPHLRAGLYYWTVLTSNSSSRSIDMGLTSNMIHKFNMNCMISSLAIAAAARFHRS